MPSEYLPTRRRAAASSRPTSSSSASTRCAGTPMVWAETASASRPRRPACWADASSRMPTRRPGAPGGGGGRGEGEAAARPGFGRVGVAPAEDLGVAAVGLGEADEHPHRGGLAGAVGAEKARDGARRAAECDVRDDGAPAELL